MSVQPQQQNHTRALARRPADYRPNAAPAYYLGRPASLWVSVTSPRLRRTPAPVARNERCPCPAGRVEVQPRRPAQGPGGTPSSVPAHGTAVTPE